MNPESTTKGTPRPRNGGGHGAILNKEHRRIVLATLRGGRAFEVDPAHLQVVRETVVEITGVAWDQITSRDKSRADVTTARHTAMWLLDGLGESLNAITRAMGYNQHGSIKYGIEKMHVWHETYPEIAVELDRIKALVRTRVADHREKIISVDPRTSAAVK